MQIVLLALDSVWGSSRRRILNYPGPGNRYLRAGGDLSTTSTGFTPYKRCQKTYLDTYPPA